MRGWIAVLRALRHERHVDTRGWPPEQLIAVAAQWERLGDQVGGPLAGRCYRVAEVYRMKAWITGQVIRGEGN